MPDKSKPGPGEDGFQLPENFAIFVEPYVPKNEERPRVVLSFAKAADELLLSGMLDGGDEIAGKPVAIDSPLGKGHILLFANNPMWRVNTQGSYALIFNAILNYQNLVPAGPPPKKQKRRNDREGGPPCPPVCSSRNQAGGTEARPPNLIFHRFGTPALPFWKLRDGFELGTRQIIVLIHSPVSARSRIGAEPSKATSRTRSRKSSRAKRH